MDRSLFETLVRQTPATVAVQLILDRLLPHERLDELFVRHAQGQYQKELLFRQLVELTIDVVLGEQPSVHAAFRHHAPRLSVSFKSVDNKLNGMELAISAALVADSARRAAALLGSLGATPAGLLPNYRVRILDGNGLSATDRRIEELRCFWDAPLPGKVLAVLDASTGLVTEVFLTPDGHAQERSLLPEVIQAVQAGDLWVADRNFCTHDFLHQIDQREAAFVIRQHGRVHGREPGEWSSPVAGPTGTVSEQALSIDHDGQRKTFRRIRVALSEPTREGETEIDVLTNLPASVDAATVAQIYRQRWSIEGLFRQMAETLECEPKTLCQPRAFEFVFCLGLVATHAVQVLRAGLRRVHGAEVWASLSLYYRMGEIHPSSPLVRSLLGEAGWDDLRRWDESEWVAELLRILGHLPLADYRKAKTRARQPPKRRQRYRNGGHVSTHQILEQRKKPKD